jgi:class 3 adenylate cyclase
LHATAACSIRAIGTIINVFARLRAEAKRGQILITHVAAAVEDKGQL